MFFKQTSLSKLELSKYIAHACGVYDGIIYSNSKEALLNSARVKYKFIEIDIIDTLDNKFVLLHDWFDTRERLFGKRGKVDYKTFINDKMINNMTQLDVDDAFTWLNNNQDVIFVLDIKLEEKAKFLSYVKKKYPYLIKNIIPQISNLDDYKKALEIGFENIIFAFYDQESKKNQIENILRLEKLIAISMFEDYIDSDKIAQIHKAGIKVIVPTINNLERQNSLEAKGVDVFFTDFLC